MARAVLLLAAAPGLVAGWGETEDEPGGPIDHREMDPHPGTGMGRPDCVPCMEMPRGWWAALRARGLHPGRRFGPGTKSFLDVQAGALQELWISSNGATEWPQQWRNGWGNKKAYCNYNSWGYGGGAQDVLCQESLYNPPPPGGCGGLIKELVLAHGHVKGTLPESFKWLVGMERLEIPDSQLSGTLPDFGLWIASMIFDLHNNKLSGTIPDDFLPAPCLQNLNLRDNEFEGTIPKSIGGHSVMMSLNLANNRFEGTIPNLGPLPELAELDLSGNRLSGTLPSDLWEGSPRLRWIKLHQNKFSGPVPATIAHAMSEVSVISVANNPDMDKMLPAELGELPLRVFNASAGMKCPTPDMFKHVPETTICGGREPGGTQVTYDVKKPSGPG